MKVTPHQKLFVLGVLLVNAVVWAVPSDVVELVARDRHTLLGRYSREHFAWIIALVPMSIVAVYIHFSPNNAVKKIKAFRVAVVLLATIIPLVAVDVYLRLSQARIYEFGTLAYHRPPHAAFNGVFTDMPEAVRTYPHTPGGFGEVPWTLTTGKRGFRNPLFPDGDRYDVVVLGDSFAEGSKVSDAHIWPVGFSEHTGLTVCNLGVSGYAPHNSLAALRSYGLALQPRWVVYLLYEGNDFHSAKLNAKTPSNWDHLHKHSPVRNALDQALIRLLGPIGAKRKLKALDILSWLPVRVPASGMAKATCYAFSPNDLDRLCVTRSGFESGKRWVNTRGILERILSLSREAGAELVVVYAPVKPRVVLPLVRDELPAEKVRAFLALRSKKDLPEPEVFLARFFENLDVKEAVTRDWCDGKRVPFLSLTEPLRDAVREGAQVYYTYNEHWSPVGHALVGELLRDFWTNRLRQRSTTGGE